MSDNTDSGIPLDDYTISDPDAFEAALSSAEREVAEHEAAVAAQKRDRANLASRTQEPDVDDKSKPDGNAGSDNKAGDRPDIKPIGDKPKEGDADAKPAKEDKPDVDGNDKQQADAKLSPYDKEKQRQSKAWQKINEEKESLRRERMAIEAEKAKGSVNPPSQRPYTAEQLKAAIPKWEAEGKLDFVEMAKEELKELEKIGGGDADPAKMPQRSVAFQKQQADSWEKAKANYPEMMHVGSPLNSAVREFIQKVPRVMDFEDGPMLAAEFVDAKLKSGRLPELMGQIDSLNGEKTQLLAKIKDLEAQLSPGGGSAVSSNRGELPFGELSVSEMEKKLRAEIGM